MPLAVFLLRKGLEVRGHSVITHDPHQHGQDDALAVTAAAVQERQSGLEQLSYERVSCKSLEELDLILPPEQHLIEKLNPPLRRSAIRAHGALLADELRRMGWLRVACFQVNDATRHSQQPRVCIHE